MRMLGGGGGVSCPNGSRRPAFARLAHVGVRHSSGPEHPWNRRLWWWLRLHTGNKDMHNRVLVFRRRACRYVKQQHAHHWTQTVTAWWEVSKCLKGKQSVMTGKAQLAASMLNPTVVKTSFFGEVVSPFGCCSWWSLWRNLYLVSGCFWWSQNNVLLRRLWFFKESFLASTGWHRKLCDD